jgi:hypothetical protein
MQTLKAALSLTREQAQAAMAAMRRVVASDVQQTEASRNLLRVAATELEVAQGSGVADGPTLRAAFPQPAQREALANSLLIAACIEGEVSQARQDEVARLVVELDVRSHWVDLLPALRKKQVFAVKRAMFSSSPDAKRMFARTWQEEGVMGFVRLGLFGAGLHRDAALSARFRALSSLPEGTFGRTLHDHIVGHQFSFPGERGGVPERMMHHDLIHVVNGYGTDAAGECEVAGFYCGASAGDAFTFIVTVLATFQLGLAVSPAVVTPARGAFDPARVVRAFVRGRALSVDIMGQWNYWELFPLPLEEARSRLGIADTAILEAA